MNPALVTIWVTSWPLMMPLWVINMTQILADLITKAGCFASFFGWRWVCSRDCMIWQRLTLMLPCNGAPRFLWSFREHLGAKSCTDSTCWPSGYWLKLCSRNCWSVAINPTWSSFQVMSCSLLIELPCLVPWAPAYAPVMMSWSNKNP